MGPELATKVLGQATEAMVAVVTAQVPEVKAGTPKTTGEQMTMFLAVY
jgi:hypothetical protein